LFGSSATAQAGYRSVPIFPAFLLHQATFPQPSGGEFGRTFVQVLFCFHMQSTVTRSDSLEAMSIVPTESEYPLAEGPGVFLWRFQRSLAMGFEGRLADRIAVTQIDLHQLERLIFSGCPPGTAYRILRP
jgi:hypothetical protein